MRQAVERTDTLQYAHGQQSTQRRRRIFKVVRFMKMKWSFLFTAKSNDMHYGAVFIQPAHLFILIDIYA